MASSSRASRKLGALDLGTASALSLAAHATIAFGFLGVIHLAQVEGCSGRSKAEAVFEPYVRVRPPSEAMEIELEIPQVAHASPLVARPDGRAPEMTPGGSPVARLDEDRRGRGGDESVKARAVNLADQDDRITLVSSTMTSLTMSQLQRLDTHKRRRSYENYRASREPMELTFVAMGKQGRTAARHGRGLSDPARGALAAASAEKRGGVLGALSEQQGLGSRPRSPGVEIEGASDRDPSPRRGVPRFASAGGIAASADVARARPLVSQGDPSLASRDNGRPNDDSDDPQAVEPAMRALMDASTAGGKKIGEGRGGEPGPSASPGAGGNKGAGQTASGAGQGGNGPADVERNGYMRAVSGKVNVLFQKGNAFPKAAALEGKSGTAVIAFTIEADGSVSSARVARASGIPEFDAAVRRFVLQSAPFGKLPSSLGSRFTMSITFASPNPAVRPKFSNDGMQ